MNNKSETIKIIASLAIIDENDINDEDALSNIGIDSLRSVELIVALEDSLNITFDDSDLDPE
ncbi:MAG: acyl carrier protein, partial [Defluviitaleaceae bacterium]|nr:acyl carrier protein [Defluviitaleaceae bacterium]